MAAAFFDLLQSEFDLSEDEFDESLSSSDLLDLIRINFLFNESNDDDDDDGDDGDDGDTYTFISN
jgi:hypothetical protein